MESKQLIELRDKMQELLNFIEYPDIYDDSFNLNLIQSTLLELIEEQRKQQNDSK